MLEAAGYQTQSVDEYFLQACPTRLGYTSAVLDPRAPLGLLWVKLSSLFGLVAAEAHCLRVRRTSGEGQGRCETGFCCSWVTP